MEKLSKHCGRFEFAGCLRLRHLKLRVAVSLSILLLCNGFSQSFAIEYTDGEYQTRQADIERLKQLLNGTPNEMSARQFRESSVRFTSSQLSHTIRLSVLKQESLSNPEFRRQFPEAARVLSQNPEASVRLSLVHDWAKNIEETKLANEGLSRSQGLNYRELLKGIDRSGKLSVDQAKELGAMIRDKFINDINVGEYRVLKSSYKQYSPSPEFTRIHSLMTAVEDWHDTAHFRTDIGAERKSTVQWIEFLEQKENAFKDTPKKDLEFMKKYAQFLDTQKPYEKNPELFKQSADLGKHSKPDQYKKAFLKRGDELARKAVADAKVTAVSAQKTAKSVNAADGAANSAKASANASSSSGPSSATSNTPINRSSGATGADGAATVAKNMEEFSTSAAEGNALKGSAAPTGTAAVPTSSAALSDIEARIAAQRTLKLGAALGSSVTEGLLGFLKGTVVVGAAIEGGKYLYRPEKSNLFDAMGTFSGAGDLGVCDSFECNKFMRECGRKLKLGRDAPLNVIRNHEQFESICIADFFRQPLNRQEKLRADDPNLSRILSDYSPSIRDLQCSSDPQGTGGRSVIVQYDTKTFTDEFDMQKISFDSSRKVQAVEKMHSGSTGSDKLVCSGSNPKFLRHCKNSPKLVCQDYDLETVRRQRLYIGVKNRDSILWARLTDQMISRQSAQIHKCCAVLSCHQYFSDRFKTFKEAQAQKQLFRDGGVSSGTQ